MIYNGLRRRAASGTLWPAGADKGGGRGVHISAAAQQIGGKGAMMPPSTPED
jgi:hypothetical protein